MGTRLTTVTRWGYKDTHSTAGRPEHHDIVVNDVDVAHKWHNVNGNPNYYIVMKDGTFYRLVDDYGGTNDLESCHRITHKSCAAARRSDWRLG